MLNLILSFGKCLVDFILLFWFSEQFFKPRQNLHKVVPSVIILCLSVFLNLINMLQIPQVNTSAAVACAVVINLLLFTGNPVSRLLCSVAQVLVMLLCEFIPISIYSFLDSRSIAEVTGEIIKNAGFNIISSGLFTIIIILIRYIISLKHQRDNNEAAISENLGIITVPLVSILTIYYILFIHSTNTVISEKFPMQSTFIFLGLLIMNVTVIIGDHNLRRHYQLQRELDRLARLEQQNHLIIEQQDQYIEELKGFAHDYAKQMEGIKKIIASKDGAAHSELQTYSEEMYVQVENSYRFAFIPSAALRAILTHAQMQCNASQIAFDADICYTDFSFISFPDLYTLFENPLENAITACKALTADHAPAKIQLTIFRQKNMVWIKIKNPLRNPILKKNQSIQSTKQDSSRHGLGLKNIERVISRYGGYMDIEYTTDRFSLTLALPVPPE